MFHLIIVIVSIILTSAVVMTGVNYIPSTAIEQERTYNQAIKGIETLEEGVKSYLNWNRDSEGYAVLPGVGNLKGTLSPSYVYYPPPVREAYSWEVQEGSYLGMPAIGICLSPTSKANKVNQEALERLVSRLPEGSAVLGSACNSTTHTPGGTHLTSWVILDHLNILAVKPIVWWGQ